MVGLGGLEYDGVVTIPWDMGGFASDAQEGRADGVRVVADDDAAPDVDEAISEGLKIKKEGMRARASSGDYGQRSLDAARRAKAEADASASVSATPVAKDGETTAATPGTAQSASPDVVLSGEANSAETTDGGQDAQEPESAADVSILLPRSGASVPEGMALVGVRGTFVTASDGQSLDTAIDRINEIRLDAYNSGLVDRYVPISRSASLECTSQIRAVEATVYPGHARPNGEGSASIGAEGFASAGLENIAWGGRTLHDAIDQWAAEKQNYENALAGNPTGESGHYGVMVDPDNTHVGLGMFVHSARYGTTVVARFASSDPEGPAETVSGAVVQGIYVPAGVVHGTEFELSSSAIGPKAVFETTNIVIAAGDS